MGNYDQIPGSEVVIEQYLVGPQFCVDGFVMTDGTVHAFEFAKTELGPEPYFQNIGFTMCRPEDLPESGILSDYVMAVIKAVGITVGAFHSELRLTKDGPVLIEIANRLPSDHMPVMSEKATGISFAKCALAAVCELPLPKPGVPKARVAASQYVIAPGLMGQAYKRLDGLEAITSSPLVDEFFIDIPAGKIIPPYADARSRIVEIQYHADSIAEAQAFRERIIKEIRVEA